MIILLFEWFYNHPALRYGGYQLLCLLLFLPVSNFLSSKKNFKNVLSKTNVLLIIGLIIFFGRNVNRLINENIKYNFNPYVSPVYRITDNHFSIHSKLNDIINNKSLCETNKKKCTDNIDVKEKYGYRIFFRKIK